MTVGADRRLRSEGGHRHQLVRQLVPRRCGGPRLARGPAADEARRDARVKESGVQRTGRRAPGEPAIGQGGLDDAGRVRRQPDQLASRRQHRIGQRQRHDTNRAGRKPPWRRRVVAGLRATGRPVERRARELDGGAVKPAREQLQAQRLIRRRQVAAGQPEHPRQSGGPTLLPPDGCRRLAVGGRPGWLLLESPLAWASHISAHTNYYGCTSWNLRRGTANYSCLPVRRCPS
eukprot:scaffold7576_cov114-Isochrysis_galbana.AAC.6